MPRTQTPLSSHQLGLLNIIAVAHANLGVARKVRQSELARRTEEARLRIANEHERLLQEAIERVRYDLDREIAAHESALDEALLTAYNEAVPIHRIAVDGFGLRYDGTVTALLGKLRADGRVGNRENFHRDTDGEHTVIAFPKVASVEELLAEVTSIDDPSFKDLGEVFITDDFSVRMVQVRLDERDPYFRSIASRMRPGSKNANETSATLYLSPVDQTTVLAHESSESSEQYWDHPVARWVKEHQTEARAGYDAAITQ